MISPINSDKVLLMFSFIFVKKCFMVGSYIYYNMYAIIGDLILFSDGLFFPFVPRDPILS